MKYQTILFTLLICSTFGSFIKNKKCDQSDQIQLHFLSDPFRVVGKASGVLEAEQVTIGLTITTIDKQAAADSLNANSQILANAIADFKLLGLSESEFSTSGLQVYPSYVSMYNKTTNSYDNVFEGYRVRNSLTINTKKQTLAGKIIDKAVQNGITNIDYITYSPLHHSIVKLRETLLAEAVKNANKQADIVLKELGYEIQSVKSINILDNNRYPNYYPSASPRPQAAPEAKADTQTFGSTDRQEIQVEVSYIISEITSD